MTKHTQRDYLHYIKKEFSRIHKENNPKGIYAAKRILADALTKLEKI